MAEGAHKLVGTTLGGTYRIVRLVGEGGMGAVYEASHTRIPRRFAVKVLRGQVASDPDTVARFHREAMIGGKLLHENIAQVLDFNSENGTAYLVMELLEGKSLLDVVRADGPLPLARATSIIHQAASALAVTHAAGIIHRDLKPENVYLCPRSGPGAGEIVKLLDFGLAKMLEPQSWATQASSAVFGTPWYMAPEQAEGRLDAISNRTDLFALGLIFYFALAGRHPFEGTSIPSVLYKVVHSEPPSLAPLRPDLPAAIVELITRATTKDPEHRFPSAEAFLRALAATMKPRWREVLTWSGAPADGGAPGSSGSAPQTLPPSAPAAPAVVASPPRAASSPAQLALAPEPLATERAAGPRSSWAVRLGVAAAAVAIAGGATAALLWRKTTPAPASSPAARSADATSLALVRHPDLASSAQVQPDAGSTPPDAGVATADLAPAATKKKARHPVAKKKKKRAPEPTAKPDPKAVPQKKKKEDLGDGTVPWEE